LIETFATAVSDPRIAMTEDVRDRALEAANHVPVEPLPRSGRAVGTTLASQIVEEFNGG
jgi:hypothetical protein